jgi:SAM-dependent methyltransferase
MSINARPIYDARFYKENNTSQLASAPVIVSAVKQYVQPESVIDIGCGGGNFLAEWKRQGIKEVLGVDGAYINRELLALSEDEFMAYDITNPILLPRRYDLSICLEVAEHLEERFAGQLIDSLCHLSDVVLFSAAIPCQGGLNHVNERYPSYWASLFGKRSYTAMDCIRPEIWNDERADWFYRQNIFLFVKDACISRYPALNHYQHTHPEKMTDIVHPKLYDMTLKKIAWLNTWDCTRIFEKTDDILARAKGRDIVLWGAGQNLEAIRKVFSRLSNQEIIVADGYKKPGALADGTELIPLSRIKDKADLFFIVFTMSAHSPDAERQVYELGYGKNDHCWFID